jgi:hypothetical protein
MSPDEREQRRATFWMVYRGDLWEVCFTASSLANDLTTAQSLSSGRAARLATPSIDCRYPDGVDKRSSLLPLRKLRIALTHNTEEPGFPDGHEVLAEVIECTAVINPPAYSAILNLDMRLRELRASDGRGRDAAELGRYPAISIGASPPF